uniref:Uncharacterized protein n=1 Tax=Vespula pensylvanica TaxID=30213 RepID=A0A834NF38_VESPE|nr:hypothetical protein H0235_014296 [Vespula pensylvanica]
MPCLLLIRSIDIPYILAIDFQPRVVDFKAFTGESKNVSIYEGHVGSAKMRRFDDVRGTRKTGASPPFRVLTTRDSSYLGSSSSSSSIIPQPRSTTSPKIQLPAQPPTPPPPTAPEPYKLVPAGMMIQ